MCDKCDGNCNSCNCTCQEPCLTPDCACKVFITTDCVTLSEDLSCSNIPSGQTATEVLKQLDAYICERFQSVENFLQIINVGGGAGIYKGISVLGKKELKSLVSDGTITITPGTDTIEFSVNIPTPELQDLQSVLNVGKYAEFNGGKQSVEFFDTPDTIWLYSEGVSNSIFSQLIVKSDSIEISNKIGDTVNNIGLGNTGLYFSQSSVSGLTNIGFNPPVNSNTNLKFPNKNISGTYILATLDDIPTVDGSETKIINGVNTTITGDGTIGSPYQIAVPSVDGSETKINAGTNISISGIGTIGNPYIINNPGTQITEGSNVSITGDGSIATPYVINSTGGDGSETKIIDGMGTTVSGNGTLATPYQINIPKNNIINTGYFQTLNIGTSTGLSVFGDIVSATTTLAVTPDHIVLVTVANTLPANYTVDVKLESLNTDINDDNDVAYPVFKKVNSTQFQLGFRELSNNTQALRVHIDVKAY